MASKQLYLKQNVLVEPLFNQWYIWPYLISPATAAMFVANSHLKIMQSFVTSPQIHIAANQNPAMMGGPFINYGADRAGEIKVLLDKTAKEQAQMLVFARAVKDLDEILYNGPVGYSLETMYQKAPEALRGYVELVYDLNHRASVRFVEGLLYKSRYYNPSSQSVALSLIEDDTRSFVFSTPRLEDSAHLHVKKPLSCEGYDELFRMKSVPGPVEPVMEMLGIEEKQNELFLSFFTEDGAPTPDSYDGDGVRIRYLGHACVLIESGEVSVLCDPVISYKYDNGLKRYTYADLPESIDFVLVTHNHQDHCMFETLVQLRHKVKNFVVPKNNGGGLADPSLYMALKNTGFRNVMEIDEMGAVPVEGGDIRGLPFFGEHGDLNIKTKIAYCINLKGRTIICAADSNNIEPRLYDHLREIIGPADVMFIGMECDGAPMSWAYGPLFTTPLARKFDQTRRLNGSNSEKAVNIVDRLQPKRVYVYAMGQEPWLSYVMALQYTAESVPIIESDKFVSECRERGIMSERLFAQKDIHL